MGSQGHLGTRKWSKDIRESAPYGDYRSETGNAKSDRSGEVLDFTRCVRSDGSAYGTPGQCRKGVEQERPNEEKIARVNRALSSSFDDYIKEFGAHRDKLFNAGADDLTRIAEQGILGSDDYELDIAIAAEQMYANYKILQRVKESGKDVNLAKLAKTNEMFLQLKWKLLNQQFGVTPGTLKLAWEMDANSNAKKALKTKHPYGQRRVVIPEHIVPTATLVKDFLNQKFNSPIDIVRWTAGKNLLSMTSAPEDYKIEKRGFKSTMGKSGSFSRYDESKVKLLPLSRSLTDGQIQDLHRALNNSVKKAKKDGMSYEEWTASVVDL